MDLNKDGDCADDGENVTYNLFVDTNNIQVISRNDNTGTLGSTSNCSVY